VGEPGVSLRHRKHPHVVLLGTILLTLVVQPLFFLHVGRHGWISVALTMCVLLAALEATQASGRVRRFMAIGVALSLVAGWLGYGLWESGAADGNQGLLNALFTVRHSMAILFFGTVVTLLIRVALAPGRISADRIVAAICVYMLLGALWAEGYALLWAWYGPVLSPAGASMGDVTYFSFVTLTTLGYGDVLPVHPAAKAAAFLEAVTGVLYLATLVARLVALQIIHQEMDD
jgi:hypothetical protein